MKVLYWNARGVGNLDTRPVLQNLCMSTKPDFLFISEPWIPVDKFPVALWKKLKLFMVNSRESDIPNLWGLCAEHLCPQVVNVSHQQISLSLLCDNTPIYISAVYACTTHTQRRQLWLELANLQQSHVGPWCFIGDFNSVLGAHEKKGGGLPLRASCEEFRSWSESGHLTHLLTRGVDFTWSNGRRGAFG